MKAAMRVLAVVTAFALAALPRTLVHGAERDAYTYTVTFSAGTQGSISSDGISVDGGGDYEISCDGKHVIITGLTLENHVRFLNSAVSLGEDSKYYVKGVRMGGRDNSTVDLAYFPVERDQDYVVAYGIRGNLVQYTVHYEDTAGNELFPPQTYYGNVGDKPVVAYLYVEGYQPQAYNLTRTLQEDVSRNVFTFVYAPVVEEPAPQPPQPPQPPQEEPGTETPAPTPEAVTPAAPAVTPSAPAPEGEEPVPTQNPEEENPQQEEQPENPEDADQGTGNTEIPDNEVPQNQGPENVRDLDESETPLGNFQPGDEGTIAAANRVKTRNAILAGGIGLLALIVLAAALYTYRKMRKAKHGKSGK